MTITRRAALALPGLALLPRPARAAFPDRPIRIIVPFAAGTSSDFQARMIGERMAPLLRQPVIVENRAGAGGVVGADAVAKAPPDGYTLLLGSNGPLTNAPVLQARLPYDLEKDFAAVAMISRSPVTLSVRTDSPFRNLADLLAAARAKPGDLSIGSSGQGSATHFLIEQVMAAAGIRLTHVPYRGSSQSVPDLIAGNIPLVMAEISTILPLWQSGRARILAMSSAGRMPIAPEIPTLIEQGRNLTGGSWAGLVTTASAPPAGTWWESAQERISELSWRISQWMRPTAFWSESSERKELEQTSSASPSVRWASVPRTGRISCKRTGTPA